MLTVAIKVHGAGHLRRSPDDTEPWNESARQYIDPAGFETIIAHCVALSRAYRIILVPGGTASHMYTSLARDLGLGEETQKRVGCLCVDAIATIYAAAIKSRLPPNSVSLAEVGARSRHNANAKVVITRPSLQAMSNDSLAVKAAQAFGASALFLLKNGIPYLYGGLEKPTRFDSISVHELHQLGEIRPGRPGHHYILDRQALDELRGCSIPAFLLNPDSIGDIPDVMQGGTSNGMTRILLD